MCMQARAERHAGGLDYVTVRRDTTSSGPSHGLHPTLPNTAAYLGADDNQPHTFTSEVKVAAAAKRPSRDSAAV